MLRTNTLPEFGQPLTDADRSALGPDGAARVLAYLATRADYAPTPLVRLPALAAALEIEGLFVKDEGQRLGLGSFKALGGAYAVLTLVAEAMSARLNRPFSVTDWASPEAAATAGGMTFACATDGNHGRSVAQGAQLVGAQCRIFIHTGVSEARAAAIARFGATLIRVPGAYDAAVKAALEAAEANGWALVSDTSWPGYETIPRRVMQGYTAMMHETAQALETPPTHIFIQAGVGGVAAAVAAYASERYGPHRPHVTVVEPSRAACLFESLIAGAPVALTPGEPTVMAMLECYEPSWTAWAVLARQADAFMTVEEHEAVAAMRRLARPLKSDPAVVAGESGGAGLAGLMQAARDPEARQRLGLSTASRILVINTEGATDPERYAALVGVRPADVG